MSTIVTRAGKGSALTHNEVDANFNNLNNDKIEAAQSVTLTNKTISGSNNTLSNIGNSSLTNSSVTIGSTSVSLGSTATTVSGLTLSSPTISGGTVDNASVGATTPSSGAFTTLSASSTVSGTGFSTYLASPPAIGGTTPAAGSFTTLSATGVTTVQAGTVSAPAITTSGDTNTGVFFPAADTVAIGTGGTEALRVNSSGNLGIGTTSPGAKLAVIGTSGTLSNAGIRVNSTPGTQSASSGLWLSGNQSTSHYNWLLASQYNVNATFEITPSTAVDGATFSNPVYTVSNAGLHKWFNGTTQAMTLDASGNLLVGATSVSGLTPSGAAKALVLNSTDATLSGAVSYVANGVIKAYHYVDSDGLFAHQVVSNAGQKFYTNNTERARIDASGFTQFSSNLVMPYQGAPTSKSTTATLTGAELITGILNTTGTTYTITLPTGTNIEGALTWSANNVCLDFFVINTASGTITIGANGNTTLGSLTIATGTSAHFRIRRTAANTFTVYRL